MIIAMEHVGEGGDCGVHCVYTTKDDSETGYLTDLTFEGWIAKQQYGSDEWDYNPLAPSEAIKEAKELFI
jgi:hypothetical protein